MKTIKLIQDGFDQTDRLAPQIQFERINKNHIDIYINDGEGLESELTFKTSLTNSEIQKFVDKLEII